MCVDPEIGRPDKFPGGIVGKEDLVCTQVQSIDYVQKCSSVWLRITDFC